LQALLACQHSFRGTEPKQVVERLACVVDAQNPTRQIDLDFAGYIAERERDFAARSVNGVPDYSFSLDEQLRRKIALVRPVRDLAHAMTSIWAPDVRHTTCASASL
jgi:hypothetical protein